MDFSAYLNKLHTAQLYRSPYLLSSIQDREVILGKRKILLFCSNNYLGLNTQKEIQQAAIEAVNSWGVGSGGSRLVSGNLQLHTELELLLAQFKGSEATLLFSSGYAANLGVISAIADAQFYIFSDALNHASIIDGCRLSRAQIVVYAHKDLIDLETKIRNIRPKQGLIVTDSVFSMDGDIAPLPELAEIAHRHNLLLLVDDAHATGVLGATGRGSLEYFNLSHQDVPIVVTTLSKAIPAMGGAICATKEICDFVRNTARSFIFSTALTPATVATAHASILFLLQHPEIVVDLRNKTKYLRKQLASFDINVSGDTPIFPILIGEETKAIKISNTLLEMGIFVPCIRYPSVARGSARLRLTVSVAHTYEDLDFVATTLAKVVNQTDSLSGE